MQDSIEPKKSVSFNANANIDLKTADLDQAMVELSKYKIMDTEN